MKLVTCATVVTEQVPYDGGNSPTELIDNAALTAGGEREKRRGRPGTLTLDGQKAAWGLPPP
jgi:hypothetical protein